LTYIIQLIYDKAVDGNLIIQALILISIPNGKLKKIYGDSICGGSKNKGEAFRYYYRTNPYFKSLEKTPLIIKILYLHDLFINREEDIIGFKIS